MAGLTFLVYVMVRTMFSAIYPLPALLVVRATLVRVADPDLEGHDLGVR